VREFLLDDGDILVDFSLFACGSSFRPYDIRVVDRLKGHQLPPGGTIQLKGEGFLLNI
jgi:hypothetical protein